jgi:hypothetical protein
MGKSWSYGSLKKKKTKASPWQQISKEIFSPPAKKRKGYFHFKQFDSWFKPMSFQGGNLRICGLEVLKVCYSNSRS